MTLKIQNGHLHKTRNFGHLLKNDVQKRAFFTYMNSATHQTLPTNTLCIKKAGNTAQKKRFLPTRIVQLLFSPYIYTPFFDPKKRLFLGKCPKFLECPKKLLVEGIFELVVFRHLQGCSNLIFYDFFLKSILNFLFWTF